MFRKKKCFECHYLTYVTSQKNLDPFLPVFSHFFMSYFDVFGSIFEKSAMTDLPKVIVSICLVSYNICMIPHVWGLTFGLNLSGAWGDLYLQAISDGDQMKLKVINFVLVNISPPLPLDAGIIVEQTQKL